MDIIFQLEKSNALTFLVTFIAKSVSYVGKEMQSAQYDSTPWRLTLMLDHLSHRHLLLRISQQSLG